MPILLALIVPGLAAAHPALLQASPTPGLVIPQAPAEIQLAMNEPAVAEGSLIELRELGGEGASIPLGDLKASDDGRTLEVKPADTLPEGVYEVRWSAIGSDGHQVAGRFAFGVAGPDGEAPDGVQALIAYGDRGGPGAQDAAGESVISVFARWLAIAFASLLFGGGILIARLRRVSEEPVPMRVLERWRYFSLFAWLLMAMGVFGIVTAVATAGAEGSFDVDALLASPTGVGAVIELGAVIAISIALLVLRRRPAPRDLLLVIGGGIVLGGQALTGHVQTIDGGKALAAFIQLFHVGSAGIWFGGALTVAAATIPLGGRPAAPFRETARGFAPLAAVALGVSVLTGVIAALREVDDLYFLKFSAYGNVVIAKSLLVLVAGLAGLYIARRSARSDGGGSADGGRPTGVLRGELIALGLVVVLAATLSGLAPGRSQGLPAERGTLLPGPAVATAVADGGPLRVTLAPARTGTNELSVVPEAPAGETHGVEAKTVDATLTCSCSDEKLEAELTKGEGGTWSTQVDLPDDGPWYAEVRTDSKTASPIALPVGVPEARGSEPLTVLAVADLTGSGAGRCRDQLMGLEIAIGKLNALGGLDGGHKVALLALDDGGSPEEAKQIAEQAIADYEPFAVTGVCGGAAAGAVEAASAAGVPTIVGDPAVPLVDGDDIYRLAGDPYAEGVALGQLIEDSVVPQSAADVVRVVGPGDAIAQRRLDGLESVLGDSDLEVEELPADALSKASTEERKQLLSRHEAAAVLVDDDPTEMAKEFADLGTGPVDYAPAVVFASERALSERLVATSGTLGRIGAIQGAVGVAPDSTTAQVYSQALPALYPGEKPSLDGLRGYVSGLALGEGVQDGIEPTEIQARLQSPPLFADALTSPWRSDAPATGSQLFSVFKGTFLPANLIPASVGGGQTYNGTFFVDGDWSRLTQEPLGPELDQPPEPIAGTS